jgi:predicted GNAT family N-acyltransferase
MTDNNLQVSLGHFYGPEHAVAHPEGGEFWVRPARVDEMEDIHKLIASEISQDVGPVEAMRAVYLRNPVSFWRIDRRSQEGAVMPIGMYGFLPLNADGEKAFQDGTLNRREPQLDFIAPEGTRPAAMYAWALVARRIGRLTYPAILKALGPMYRQIPWYAIPATKGGVKAVTDRGFAPTRGGPNDVGSVSQLAGSPTDAPSKSTEPRLAVEVASSADHLQMSAFIRGATFGAEQACPYHEEFDGNDFCAMHLIGFVDGEPAATLRIRFFATFAKLERLAVLERFRRTAIKYRVMERAIEVCRRKGYTLAYGQSQERLIGFYAKFGFRPMQKNRRLVFSDHNYIEIVCDLEPHPESIKSESDPYLIIRPEGRWELEGILEKSSARPATNPVGPARVVADA